MVPFGRPTRPPTRGEALGEDARGAHRGAPYNVLERTVSNPEFQKAVMKVAAKSGAYAITSTLEQGMKKE